MAVKKNNTAIKNSPKHLLGIQNISILEAKDILNEAKEFIKLNRSDSKKLDILRGKTQINLFFEPSTRTQSSFDLAGKRLGADVMTMNMDNSALKKGETLIDTAMTLNAMHPDIIVIRHQDSGACNLLSQKVNCSVLNAGDGRREHPTQALLDAFTLNEHFEKIDGLTIAICGDIAHSRVAQSNMILLDKLGAKIRIIAPPYLLPEKFPIKDVAVFDTMKEGLKECDAIMMLRNQKERMEAGLIKSDEEFFQNYGLTKERLALAKSNAVVLHPGPMNRNVEIADDVADDSNHSLILKQVENGVFIRMAILDLLINGTKK